MYVYCFDIMSIFSCCYRDTLFHEDFNINDIINRHQKFQEREPDASTLVYVTCTDEGISLLLIVQSLGLNLY